MGHEVRPVQMTRAGAFDDQESGIVGELLAGVLEQVAVNVVQQGVGAGGGEGGDPFGEGVEGSGR